MSIKYNVFGVRHLSPGASFHLIEYLKEKKPKCVLIEGPTDATPMISEMAQAGVKPPIALMAYTNVLPIETVLYPFATYSPEYQAILWATRKKIEVRFIDLPTYTTLAIRQRNKVEEEQDKATEFYKNYNDLYATVAKLSDEDNYENYWERNFEQNLNPDTFRDSIIYQSHQMRDMVVDVEAEVAPFDHSYNLIREAYMRQQIEKAIANGYQAEDIVIIVGAYHVTGITSELSAMTDNEFKALPTTASQLTLMPYTYFRLSSRVGYGAGNLAPFYFELMWEQMQKGRLKDLPTIYIAKVAADLRLKGFNASSASVIEAVRLSQALASMRQGAMPVLQDLHDVVVTCLGEGELVSVAESINQVDIGTAIGSLPEGIFQTPIQEDMNQELQRLKLTSYKSTVAQELSLDLRENLKVKSKEAAFIDLNRSVFLNRLQVLGIHFGALIKNSQDKATWSEKWLLQWSPEIEIEIVETNLKGESLKIATAYQLRENLNNCSTVGTVASVIKDACLCDLADIFTNALSVLQAKLVDSNDMVDITNATFELSSILVYGDIRQFNTEPLNPVLQQLFLSASLLLVDSANCNDDAAKTVASAMNLLERVSELHSEIVDVDTWQHEVKTLAWRDDLNTLLSGTAFALLLEHNLATEQDCEKEVSRRLSPGVPASLGASWFEGLAGRNRYALLSRVVLWRQLDAYVSQLDQEDFLRSVVFLRRAFSDFTSTLKNSIAELLGELWKMDAGVVAEILQDDLSEEEEQKLDELNDFDFDF